VYSAGSLKLPVPSPSSTSVPPPNVKMPSFAVATSRFESPLKSLATTPTGLMPRSPLSLELKVSWASAGGAAMSQSATAAPMLASHAAQTPERITAPAYPEQKARAGRPRT
jgi:hypothetical protein